MKRQWKDDVNTRERRERFWKQPVSFFYPPVSDIHIFVVQLYPMNEYFYKRSKILLINLALPGSGHTDQDPPRMHTKFLTNPFTTTTP